MQRADCLLNQIFLDLLCFPHSQKGRCHKSRRNHRHLDLHPTQHHHSTPFLPSHLGLQDRPPIPHSQPPIQPSQHPHHQTILLQLLRPAQRLRLRHRFRRRPSLRLRLSLPTCQAQMMTTSGAFRQPYRQKRQRHLSLRSTGRPCTTRRSRSTWLLCGTCRPTRGRRTP